MDGSDIELLERMAELQQADARDEALGHFWALYDRHARHVAAYVTSVFRFDAQDAHDTVVDVFERVWARPGEIARDARAASYTDLRPFLRTSARNRVLDVVKRRRREELTDALDTRSVHDPVRVRIWLSRMLDELDGDARASLETFVEALSRGEREEETARRLGCGHAAWRKRISRARQELLRRAAIRAVRESFELPRREDLLERLATTSGDKIRELVRGEPAIRTALHDLLGL
jgi:DNA-directed RNA polymerase specialized sigma24 family protein